MRRLLAAPAVIALVATAMFTIPATAATAATASKPPPVDWQSPYVGAFDGQIPGPPPWKAPRVPSEADQRATFKKEYDSGIRWTYTWAPWSDIETSEGHYDFSQLDNYVRWARAEGILIRMQIMTG